MQRYVAQTDFADGVAPEVIMKLGGWSSLCFLLYWRRLELIIPAAITRAWEAQQKLFAINFGITNRAAHRAVH